MLYKHEDLSLKPQAPRKKLGQLCEHVIPVARGRGRREEKYV